MNSRLLKFLLIIFAVSTGCEEAGNSMADEKRVVYNLPPFDSITDSIKNDPDNAALYFDRALRLSQHNHHLLANEDYYKAYSISGNESTAMAYVSSLLLSQKFTRAIDFLKECIDRHPDYPEFHRRLGEVYIQTEQYDKALLHFQELVKIDKEDFEAWLEIGMLQSRLRDTAAAIKAMETSYSLLPIDYSGLALANLLVSQNDGRALEICDIILGKDSSEFQTDAFYLKGVYYAANKNNAMAIAQFDSCIKRDWKFIDAYLEKGIIYYHQQKYEQALETFTLSATVSNTVADSYFWMGRCYEAMGRKQEAADSYLRALQLDKQFYEAEKRLKQLNISPN